MVRDVFHVSGLLGFDAKGALVEIVLKRDARLAHKLIHSLQEMLAPNSVALIWAKRREANYQIH